MDSKKSPNRRNKRHSKLAEENYWDCSVCTYRNSAEAFKCLMCDVRKGTSTRKPRFNPQLVAQQAAQQYTQIPPKPKSSKSDKDKKGSSDSKFAKKTRPRLKNIDRSSAQQKAVTVNNVTVIITEFQPKCRTLSETSTNGPHSSSGSSTDSGSQSDTTSHSDLRNGDSHSSERR